MHRIQESPARRLLRVRAAARYLGVGVKRIRSLVLLGELPPIQFKAGSNSPFLLDVRELDKFIEKSKR